MLDDFARIDDKTIRIHKFSPELELIIRIFVLFKNLPRDEASSTVSNSIHRSKAQFHDIFIKNKFTSKV